MIRGTGRMRIPSSSSPLKARTSRETSSSEMPPFSQALAGSALLSPENTTAASQRHEAFPTIASEISETLPGSSAGGEQPKFLTTITEGDGAFRPVIVKFTARLEQPSAHRWADLMLCEFHAHQVLAEAGLACPGAAIHESGDRRFLEMTRFDRHGAGGRIGVVSLESLATSLLGQYPAAWTDALPGLLRHGLIDQSGQETVRLLQSFGDLIGNTDMHPGNISFFLTDSLAFRPTPAYDMLPMLWAPGPQGEIVPRRFAPAPPVPAMEDPWRQAAALAEDFWERVSADARLTQDFAPIANETRATISRLRQHVG